MASPPKDRNVRVVYPAPGKRPAEIETWTEAWQAAYEERVAILEANGVHEAQWRAWQMTATERFNSLTRAGEARAQGTP